MKNSLFICIIAILLYAQIANCQQNKIAIRRYHGTAKKMAASFAEDEAKRFSEMYRIVMKEAGINLVTSYLAFKQAKKFEPYIDLETSTEMKSFAEQAHISYEQVLLSNCFYDLGRNYRGCRQAVVWGKKSRDGSLLHARNLDWPDWGNALRANNVLLIRNYTTGNAIATFTWPGMFGSLTGCNDKGLSIAFNQLNFSENRLGTPIFMILKQVLRHANTLENALKIIDHSVFCTNGSIMIASAREKSAVLVEVKYGQVFITKSPGLFLVNNNDDYIDIQGKFKWSSYRASNLYQVVKTSGIADIKTMQAIMGHPRVMMDCNLLSVIFCLEKNELYISCDRYYAAKGPFRTIKPLFIYHAK